MPVKINIKQHKPSFEDGPAKWNVVVSGPDHVWNARIERILYMHGVEPLSSKDGLQFWSTKPAIGAPSIYLAALLARKYGADMTREVREMIALAENAQPRGNGIDALMAARRDPGGGEKPLQIVAGSSEFIANCNDDNHARIALLEGAGWLRLKMPKDARHSAKIRQAFGSAPFRCADPFIASNLEPFMSPKAAKQLGPRLAIAKANIALSSSQEAPTDFNVPCNSGIDYLPFQKGGISMILKTGKSGLIADDMGLGKTIQAVGIINGRPDTERVIVFCQANMKLKWCRELEKWLVNKDLTVGYAEGGNFPDTDIVVINYDIADRHIEAFNAVDWNIVVTDEAHSLKNHEAKRTIAILGIEDAEETAPGINMARDGIMVHLTGTPKPNRTSEIWPLISSTRPDLFGKGSADRQAFLNRYEPPTLIKKELMGKGGRPYSKIIPLPGKPVREMELQLRLRSSGSFMRRMKRDTDMPPKMRTPIEMPFKLKESDRKALAQADVDINAIGAGLAIKGSVAAGRSTTARPVIDIVAGAKPGSPHFSEIARVRRNLGILKAPYAAKWLIDELAEDDDLPVELRRKTVVFAHHKDVIAIIAAEAEKKFPGQVLIYDGSVSNKKRQGQVDLFQENPEKRIFIMSLAGATGITLTAAYRLRMVEMDWSPSNMVQIEDRVWRIGQEEDVDIGYLFVPDSLDLNIGLSLIEKMTSDEKSMNALSFDDLREKMNLRLGPGAVRKNKAAPSVIEHVKAQDQMSMDI